jgi:acetolactate synthase-1/3 small subunit
MVSVRSHTLVVLVEDKPGVMNRIVSLFRQRGFNIDSIAVGHSETPGLSRITLVAQGDDRKIEQLVKQLYKILEVIKITDVTDENLIQRELALIKVTATDRNRSDIMRLVTDVYQARIVDATPDTMVRSYGIKEIARSGVIAMARGARVVATTPQPVVA